MKKISNTSDFLREINKIKVSKSNFIFYRGHSDEEYLLEPTIYRKEKKDKQKNNGKFLYIEEEDKIYREIISRVPNEFSGKNTIESLVLMQHYNVPTRILDLTTNALVALYFACNENQGNYSTSKDGEVLVFNIPNDSVCYSDSDKITILANLAKCSRDFYYEITDIKEANNKYFDKLLHNIREDKSYFQPIIEPSHVGSVFAVRPKLDNPRIIRQQGAFLIFGIKDKKTSHKSTKEFLCKPMAEINQDWIVRGKKEKNTERRIIIDRTKKKDIIKELEKLGVSEATLFPEIDVVAKYIKSKY